VLIYIYIYVCVDICMHLYIYIYIYIVTFCVQLLIFGTGGRGNIGTVQSVCLSAAVILRTAGTQNTRNCTKD
jgi:hypothetical protein